MNVVVATESRFFRDANGSSICSDGTYGYQFWRRYLNVFDHVTILARQSETVREALNSSKVEGPGVVVRPLLDSRGALGASRRWKAWRREVQPVLTPDSAFILRLPGQIGGLVGGELLTHGIPYGVEVLGDPEGVFSNRAYRHPLRRIFKSYFRKQLTYLCWNALAVAYVTKNSLQQKYATSPLTFSTSYSSVELGRPCFVRKPRDYRRRGAARRIVCVGTMSQRYKGQQDLIEAVKLAADRGVTFHVSFVGDGRYRSSLEQLTRRLHVDAQVRFLGQVSAGESVRDALDEADLFVLPSHTEGLPRAMIEAQARGVPCLGSRVGGIPELLPSSMMFSAGAPSEIAERLIDIADDETMLTQQSHDQWKSASDYSAERLQKRRDEMYTCLANRIAKPSSTDESSSRAA